MVKIENAGQFGTLVKEFKKKHKPVLTNCYFLPSEVEEMTKKGKLYLEAADDCLTFFVEEAECSRLYYYMSEDAKPAISKREKPVILDYVFKGEEEAALVKAGSCKWEALGFAPYKRYRRMECLKGNFIPPADQQEKLKEFPIEQIKAEDYPVVAPLWRTGLDALSTLLPEEEEFARICERGEMIGIRLPNGEPGAANLFIKKGRLAFLQHLIVSPKFRGLGMGRTLMCGTIQYILNETECDKLNFWVDEKNYHAIDIYVKMGFTYDSMISRQFMLELTENK